MKLSDFSYALPDELIARRPAPERASSRLLVLEAKAAAPRHRSFRDLPTELRPGDLLVFNDTRVIPARLYACKEGTGGGVEVLVERVVDERLVLAQLRASKSPRPGSWLLLLDAEGREAARVRVLARRAGFYELEFPEGSHPLDVMNRIGHMPLPPYIDRPDESSDRERYQTVYARRDGAVAAPTAGLHFDLQLLARLRECGVEQASVTLHVGAGTFTPVRTEDPSQHRMHAEYAEVGEETCAQVMRAHREGRRVIAVGTTSLRALEAASEGPEIRPLQAETSLFIYPGYRFRAVDALITNFHLPESTLLMLVCAFAGTDRVLAAYREAVRERYRFFSYGDAMLLESIAPPALKHTGRGS